MSHTTRKPHIVLTSHPQFIYKESPAINWGRPDPRERGPHRRQLHEQASPQRDRHAQRQLRDLSRAGDRGGRRSIPITARISPTPSRCRASGRFPSWHDPEKIVSLDPWGHIVAEAFARSCRRAATSGRPSPSPRAHINMPELARRDREAGGSRPDGEVLHAERRRGVVTKAAIEPVWYLPGHRQALRRRRDGPAPHAVRADRRHVPRARHARPTSKCSCRRSAASTVYIFGDVAEHRRPGRARSPAACTTSATARTCSAPTSAPAGRT